MSCEDSRIFTTQFTCDLAEENVNVQWNHARFEIPDDMQQRVLDYWDDLPKDHIYNGSLARLDSWQTTQALCQLHLRPTDYRTLLYSNAHVQHIRDIWGEKNLARTLGVSAILQSADNQLVFMKRSAYVVEYPECYDVFGGHIDVPDNGQAPNVFAAMAHELREEVGLEPHDYSLQLIGLIEATPNKKPELIFLAQAGLLFGQILSRTRKAQDFMEFSQVHAINNNHDQIKQFLHEQQREFSPSAYAAFCVYMSR